MARDRDSLIEQAASAWRAKDPRDARVRAHPAWMDLDDEGRAAAFEAAGRARAIEAALDAEGLSTTAKAVLARIRRR